MLGAIINAIFGGGEDVPVEGAQTDEDYNNGQEIASIARQTTGRNVESVRLTQWGGIARTSKGNVEVEEDEYL